MSLYCGIDLHSGSCYLVILGGQDQVIEEGKFANQPEAFLTGLKSFKKQLSEVAVESTYNGGTSRSAPSVSTSFRPGAGSPGVWLRWTASSLLAFDTLLGLTMGPRVSLGSDPQECPTSADGKHSVPPRSLTDHPRDLPQNLRRNRDLPIDLIPEASLDRLTYAGQRLDSVPGVEAGGVDVMDEPGPAG